MSITISVGTKNKAKLSAVEQCLATLKDKLVGFQSPVLFEVIGVSVNSDVSDQPMSEEETMKGAKNRALNSLKAVQNATFGIGIEGGVQRVGDVWMESGWVVVVDGSGKMGYGKSGSYQLSNKIMKRLDEGVELATVIDEISGMHDMRSSQGAMGLLTNGILPRDMAYSHGVYFAFAPWLSDEKYWL
ncbi:hypothetical protein HK098_006390 [Nowakowskiella sp. JEL0407]|nr:hypothetical protein HK098_006390 [Nowakowskiella sp. JEL0407]